MAEDATRGRILEAAGRLFRQRGVDGVGIDAVMREAGLTHGGFYAHFASKEALVTEVARVLLERAALQWDGISGPDALARIVSGYLDAERVGSGVCCALPTLGADLARRGAAKGAIGAALEAMIGALTRCVPGDRRVRRRARALVALSTLVGAVVLARLADDPALARAFLDAAAGSLVKPTASAAGA
jgi:TetR/AcrR family transcriptional repressor of nem operon